MKSRAWTIVGAALLASACSTVPPPPPPEPPPWTWGWTGTDGAYHPVAQSDLLFRVEETLEPLEPTAPLATLRRCTWRFTALGDTGPIRSLGVRVRLPDWEPDTAFAPHLTPAEHLLIPDHTFRSPVVLESRDGRIWALIPDLHRLARERPFPWALRYRPGERAVDLLAAEHRVDTHVFYGFDPEKPIRLKGGESVSLGAYLVTGPASPNPHGAAAALLWRLFADLRPDPVQAPLERYVDRAYEWALGSWRDVAWQEFEINGTKVGGVVFIVTVHQAPGRGEPDKWREKKSLWNQAWFSSLRSATGLMRHARRKGDAALAAKARLGLEFALAAPQTNGFFPAVFVASKDGDWSKGEWEWASDRRPPQHQAYCHLTDASWTCDRLLEWHREIEADPRILAYCESYAKALVATQLPSGAFPSWVDPKTGVASPFLRESAQGMTSVMFLASLHRATGEERWLAAARRCAEFVAREVLPRSRWEDFEVWWSCSKEGPYKKLGERDPITRLWPANTLALWWAAEGFLRLGMREEARRALDELCLYQQVWSPPFLFVPGSGGFGVQNTDGEWNDARQSLFARTFFEAARVFGSREYEERARLALAASFTMMYCPENPEVRRQYQLKWPTLDERDFGFMMENYAHAGFCAADGTGIGEFTIWDWGPGGAAEAWEWARDHDYVKREGP
jgi:hypothetical protein